MAAILGLFLEILTDVAITTASSAIETSVTAATAEVIEGIGLNSIVSAEGENVISFVAKEGATQLISTAGKATKNEISRQIEQEKINRQQKSQEEKEAHLSPTEAARDFNSVSSINPLSGLNWLNA